MIKNQKPYNHDEEISNEQILAHKKACIKKENWYIDPKTGKKVLTKYFLKFRGYCCESYCRHCPYGFDKKTNLKHRNKKEK